MNRSLAAALAGAALLSGVGSVAMAAEFPWGPDGKSGGGDHHGRCADKEAGWPCPPPWSGPQSPPQSGPQSPPQSGPQSPPQSGPQSPPEDPPGGPKWPDTQPPLEHRS